MTRTTRLLTIGLATAVLAVLTPALVADGVEDRTQVLRVDFWHLWQATGAELYQELCSACHGVDGAGGGPAARALKVPTPALTDLQQNGIPQEHWTYALGSACEDTHHWTGHAHETMPCWRRLFRQALGNDSAPLLVSKKLVEYLETIQQ